MIPTFDFINVIKATVKAALLALTSPLGIVLAVSTASGLALVSISNFAFSYFFPNFTIGSVVFHDDGNWIQLVAYCINSGLLISLVQGLLSFFLWLVPFLTGFFGGVWAFMAVRSITKAHRQTVKDLAP